MGRVTFLFILAVMLLAGCDSRIQVSASPSVDVVSKPTYTKAPLNELQSTEAPEEKTEPALDEFQTDQIEAAKGYRATIDGSEYYFDTNTFLFGDYFMDFPLYKDWEYMGTTGFAFQENKGYLYVESAISQEDWPDGRMTRSVNTADGTIRMIGRNIDIFIPDEGENVYYTDLTPDQIFVTKPSLELKDTIDVRIPDLKAIQETSGADLMNYESIINVTDVKDGWVYFRYCIFEYEGSGLYEGHYRISAKGDHVEKTDEGEFDPE